MNTSSNWLALEQRCTIGFKTHGKIKTTWPTKRPLNKHCGTHLLDGDSERRADACNTPSIVAWLSLWQCHVITEICEIKIATSFNFQSFNEKTYWARSCYAACGYWGRTKWKTNQIKQTKKKQPWLSGAACRSQTPVQLIVWCQHWLDPCLLVWGGFERRCRS